MSFYALPEDTASIIIDYLPLADLYKYATNLQSIQTFKDQLTRRTIEGDLSGLELAAVEEDRNLARYIIDIINTLPEVEDVKYWNKLIQIAVDLDSTMLIKEIIRVIDPILVVDILYRDHIGFLARAFADDPEFLDTYLDVVEEKRPTEDFRKPLPILSKAIEFLGEYDVDRQLALLGNLHSKEIYEYDPKVIRNIIATSYRQNFPLGRPLLTNHIVLFSVRNRDHILSLLKNPHTTAEDILPLITTDNVATSGPLLRAIDNVILSPEQREKIIEVLSV